MIFSQIMLLLPRYSENTLVKFIIKLREHTTLNWLNLADILLLGRIYQSYGWIRVSHSVICRVKISQLKLLNLFHISIVFRSCRVNSPNSRWLPITGYRPLCTMLSHFAASGRITHWWAALWPFAPLYTDGLLSSLFPVFSTLRNLAQLS